MKIAQPVAYPLPEGHRRQPLMGIKLTVCTSTGVTLRIFSELFTENRECKSRPFYHAIPMTPFSQKVFELIRL
ncbi:MAG: hypothetical protein RIE73_14785 [Coleofasciculus sp. C1-SOL-03]|jgi:hypothetical protein|uniref:hypothetical protein n=1 Tax=Coleofasciculus sp. C1-SOL-03 TaxID=3069522 RepID=UPI003303EE1A